MTKRTYYYGDTITIERVFMVEAETAVEALSLVEDMKATQVQHEQTDSSPWTRMEPYPTGGFYEADDQEEEGLECPNCPNCGSTDTYIGIRTGARVYHHCTDCDEHWYLVR